MNTKNMYDMIIVGGGPAGLSSAIYMARAKYKTLVIEKEKFGGQITITNEIVNYPGVFKTSGTELTHDMQRQAETFGAEFKICDVQDIDMVGDIKTVKTSVGEFQSLGVILALGASPRQIGFDGESEYRGKGVAYCATCDGEFFTDMPVYVVGGGFAAVEEGIFLTKYASSVEMIVRGADFSCAKTVSEHINKEEKISVNFNTEVMSVSGENSLNKIVLKNKVTGEITEKTHENGFGVFVFAGYVPNTEWLENKIELDNGYIVTDKNQKTNIDGIYGAGDVCIKDLRQVVTAVSDGATAATSAEKYIASIHTKLDIPPFEVAQKAPKSAEPKKASTSDDSDKFISDDLREQLVSIFDKFENNVIINAVLNNSELSNELSGFANEMSDISSKITCTKSQAESNALAPYLEIQRADSTPSGIRFYAMPGGHEFNSFILALYNVAGPGKEIATSDEERIKKIDKKTDIKVLISLSCTMCPDVVVGSGKIATLNENITASAIDIAHFPEIKQKYNVMSVPCMVINDEIVHFGKKSVTQIIDILEEN